MLKRSFGLFVLVATQTAVAQPAPAAKRAAPPAAQPPPAGTRAAAVPDGATADTSPVVVEPTLPTVVDDMLAPVPPATNVLQNWRDALRLLRTNSTTLRTLEARTDVARAQSRQVLSGALPSLTGDAAITRHLLLGHATGVATLLYGTGSIPDPATAWNAGLNLSVPVIALEAWHDRGTAEAAIGVARLNTKAAERLSIAAVADAVVTAVTAERLAEVSRVSLESSLSTLDLYKRRASLGAASAIDVLRIEQEVSLSRGQVVAANDGVLRAREALGATLGSSQPYGVTPNIRLDALADDARSSCRPTNDVMTRADVRAAEGSVGVAKRSAEGINRRYWPTVDAVSSLTYWSNELSTANNKHVTWTVGGVLSWNLYDGGLREGTRAQRDAETRIAGEQLTEAKRQAQIEVTQAFRTVRTSEATLAVAGRTREVAAETARLSKVAYLNGSGTTFDLVDTARRQREAELDYTIKEFDVLRAKIAALLALATCDV
jgi:multidrug efflux system outer membrane protein